MRYWLGILFAIGVLSAHADEEIGLIPSRPDQIAALSSEPESLVGGCLHPLTGSLSLRVIDLIAKGTQSIELTRIYIPPSVVPPPREAGEMEQYLNERDYLSQFQRTYRGWVFQPHIQLEHRGYGETQVPDRNGAIYTFSQNKLSSIYGISNLAGERPSAIFDPRNIRFTRDGQRTTVSLPDGTIRFYFSPGGHLSHLEKEILPNGKILKYFYKEASGQQLDFIKSYDPKERFEYASIAFEGELHRNHYESRDKTKNHKCGKYHFNEGELSSQVNGVPYFAISKATSQSGQIATFNYELKNLSKDLRKRCGHFHYELSLPPFLKDPSTPSFREGWMNYQGEFLIEAYSRLDTLFRSSYRDLPKIESLYLPVGENDTFIPVYTLNYDSPIAGVKEGMTRVSHADGTATLYRYSKNLLLSSIQSIGNDGHFKKEKVYSWDENHWLRSIEWKDGVGNLFYKKAFEDYDACGNPRTEIFSGDLTGSGNLETYTTKRTFSEDNRNLLLSEENEDGRVIVYTYLPGTNLLLSKYTKQKQKIVIRELHQYDDCNNLKMKSIDDGISADPTNLEGVTERRVTTYTLRRAQPFLHMPERIEETYLNHGKQHLLRKTELSYDKYGNVEKEDHFGSDGKWAYTIERKFDEQGNILSETNPLGYKATSTYDSRGHEKESKNHSSRLKTEHDYDTAGRLKSTTETGDEKLVHKTIFQHDPFDRLTKTTDSFGNSTRYTYDLIAQKPTVTDLPSILLLSGKAQSVLKSATYDPLGRLLTETDPLGNTTKYKYNAYGSPIEITYPNGSQETFRYYKNGNLHLHTDREGLITESFYDLFDRVTEKRYSLKGKFLASEIFTYNAFHLKSHQDLEGYLTTYTYDGAGRKIEESHAGRIRQFSYDPLSHLAKETQINGDNTLCIEYNSDLLGQILEERKTNASGKLLYKISHTYDSDGHRKTTTRYPQNKPATTTFNYDPFARLTETKDPLGHSFLVTYDESKTNAIGQGILTKTLIDPNSIPTVITYDAYGRQASKKISDLRTEERFYDAAGNLLSIKENDRLTQYSYNSLNVPKTLTRAFGTPNARTTSYTYTPSGLLKTKKTSNEITLTYGYDPFKHCESIVSSDGTISHEFRYSSNGNLIQANDSLHRLSRTHDPFGNTLTETIDGKYTISKTYDALNRPLTITLPDGRSAIRYTYDPLYLKAIQRVSTTKEVLYSHAYDNYDLNGGLLSETLPHNLGAALHTYNLNGLVTSLKSPYFTQTLSYDPAGRVQEIVEEGTFAYDDLSELTQEPSHLYTYDNRYNRLSKDGSVQTYNALDELASNSYDRNGNLSENNGFKLTYDPLNRLTHAESSNTHITHTYDPLGRRLTKTVNGQTELYLYNGMDELCSLHPYGLIKELCVLGRRRMPIAVELQNQLFIAFTDYRGNIRRLVNPETRSIAQSLDYTAFGEENAPIAQPFNPWRYSSKRFDPELKLSYFGQRYYDAGYGRWISTDPAGFVDGMNLYQYALNNPFLYTDLYGENLLGFFVGVGEILLGGAIMASGAFLEVVSFGGYTFALGFHEAAGLSLLTAGCATAAYHARDISFNRYSSPTWKNTDVYSPDRPLPLNGDGVPIPDTDAPHTQLGTRGSKRRPGEKYPQAREFDKNGKPIKSIDFTDHGEPDIHPNPHEHPHEANPTGGTAKRGDPKPLENWEY